MTWHRIVRSSLTRIAGPDLDGAAVPVPFTRWDTGQYVVVEVDRPPPRERRVELRDGRMAALGLGDRIIGALGDRHATLEAVGSWRDVDDDLRLHLLTSGGLLGRATSVSTLLGPVLDLRYVGHVVGDGRLRRMDDDVPLVAPATPDAPMVLLVGTAMSTGKTQAAALVVHLLKQRGYRTVGAKLTGAARYRDVLAMRDAGADAVFDFADVGLPSTIVPRDRYRSRLDTLLSLVATAEPEVVVVEAGASPLEPYNGDVAVEVCRPDVAFTILCASDPYSVAGVMQDFGRDADLVAGIATSTQAGVELVDRLTGLRALNLLDPASRPVLDRLLCAALAPALERPPEVHRS